MHHFSSPKWLISEGGWENETTIEVFKKYCSYVVSQSGDLMTYVCTINEANMGLQIAAIAARLMMQMQTETKSDVQKDVQVGINLNSNQMMEKMKMQERENIKVFGTSKLETFLSIRTPEGDALIMRAHEVACDAMKNIKPELKVGITLSLHDIQPVSNGEEKAREVWNEEFTHYLPYISQDDFFGLQNYTRSLIDSKGTLPAPKGAELTQMNYEYYPQALGNVIRTVHQELSIPIIVTENGIGTEDDNRRIAFIKEAIAGVKECIEDGIPVLGYMHWSLLDNFEWQKGYSKTFGLVGVNRKTQERHPKESLKVLGNISKQIAVGAGK